MLELLVKARRWWSMLSDGRMTVATLARQEKVNDSWMTRVLRLNFLAPELIDAILSGDQPVMLTSVAVTRGGPFPANWQDQAALFSKI